MLFCFIFPDVTCVETKGLLDGPLTSTCGLVISVKK